MAGRVKFFIDIGLRIRGSRIKTLHKYAFQELPENGGLSDG
jgi:hypothetical protein